MVHAARMQPVGTEVTDALSVRGSLTEAEIASYRQTINRLAKGRINQPISNDHPTHAAILFQAMFDNSRQNMRIYTGRLAPEIFDLPWLISSAKRFLEKPCARLSILTQHKLTMRDLAARRFVQELGLERCNIKTAIGPFTTGAVNHFAVMDDHAFRIELSDEKTQAIANFNEPGIAAELAAGFDLAFGASAPLEP